MVTDRLYLYDKDINEYMLYDSTIYLVYKEVKTSLRSKRAE